jgi:hypothetical protein
VDYANLVPLLAEAIRQKQREIKALREKSKCK